MHTLPTRHPVVILVHGAGLNGVGWNPVRRHIDPRIHVITPDLPGHGARSGEPYTPAGAIETIAAAARAVCPAPVIIGGDSLGGYASTAAAAALHGNELRGRDQPADRFVLLAGGAPHRTAVPSQTCLTGAIVPGRLSA
jgi:pimeloyl-ACP methyl ester carboxylesterase